MGFVYEKVLFLCMGSYNIDIIPQNICVRSTCIINELPSIIWVTIWLFMETVCYKQVLFVLRCGVHYIIPLNWFVNIIIKFEVDFAMSLFWIIYESLRNSLLTSKTFCHCCWRLKYLPSPLVMFVNDASIFSLASIVAYRQCHVPSTKCLWEIENQLHKQSHENPLSFHG